MSVAFTYTPTAKGYVEGGESFGKALRESFGEFPITLTDGDLDKLEAMGRAYDAALVNPESVNGFWALRNAIQEFGTIIVRAEY